MQLLLLIRPTRNVSQGVHHCSHGVTNGDYLLAVLSPVKFEPKNSFELFDDCLGNGVKLCKAFKNTDNLFDVGQNFACSFASAWLDFAASCVLQTRI